MRWIAVGLLIACLSCRQNTTTSESKKPEAAAKPATQSVPAPEQIAVEAAKAAPPAAQAPAPEKAPAPPPAKPVEPPAAKPAEPAAAKPAEPAAEKPVESPTAKPAVSAAADFPLAIMPNALITEQSRVKPDENSAEYVSVSYSVPASSQEVGDFYENLLKQEKMKVDRADEKTGGGEQVLVTASSTAAQVMIIIERKAGASTTEVLATWVPEVSTPSSAPAAQQ